MSEFYTAHPDYSTTSRLDELRANEYSYLDSAGHAYLDYTAAGLAADAGSAEHAGADVATARLDVTEHIEAKVGALCAYRSQFPMEPDMFPDFLLKDLFGEEYFVQVLPPRQLETELF